jgi:hypothetical protein
VKSWRIINPQFETGIVVEGNKIEVAGDWLIISKGNDVVGMFFRPLGVVVED